MRIFQNLNVDFLGKRKYFYLLSTFLFLIGVVNVAFRGLEFGVDFKGGTEIVVDFQKPINITQLRKNVEGLGLGFVELKTFGGQTGALLRTETQDLPKSIYKKVVSEMIASSNAKYPKLQVNVADSTNNTNVTFELAKPDSVGDVVNALMAAGYQAGKASEDVNNKQIIARVGISDWIKYNLRQTMSDNSFQILREDRIGPKVGNELKVNAVLALLLSFVVILIYLAFRYKFIFGFGAVVAVFHDTLITLGLFAALYGLIPGLNLEIDLTIVAAFLTLVGYSMSDTVVVFDRVRENMKIHKTLGLEEVINLSINQTMSRTILTGGTVLLALVVLMIFGGEVLRPFAFTLFFGIVIGTYSSIFVASAMVLEYANRIQKRFKM